MGRLFESQCVLRRGGGGERKEIMMEIGDEAFSLSLYIKQQNIVGTRLASVGTYTLIHIFLLLSRYLLGLL